MNLKPLAVLVALALSGCATAKEIMSSSAPTAILDTTATPDQVQACLTQDDPTIPGMSVVEYKGSRVVFLSPPGNPPTVAWVARITATDAGPKVEIFQNIPGVMYNRYVAPCLDKLPRVANN